MTVMEFFGCALIAFGPPMSMFIFTVAKDPIRIIILIASAFFWLLSLLLSSILWFAVVPLKNHLVFGLVFSVFFQEMFRLCYYKLLRKAEAGLKKVTEADTHIMNTRHTLSFVAGLGFGLMSGAFSLVNVLADSIGPGTVGINGGSYLFFVTSAFTTLAFILMNTFWGVIFFHAMDCCAYWKVALVITSHLFVSLMTLLNPRQFYVATLVPIYIIMLIMGAWAFFTAGGTIQGLRSCTACKSSQLVVDG